MARSFHLSPYYFLLQAFDSTGEAMFGKDWSGQEVRARPPETDLRKVQSQQAKLEAQLIELEAQLAALLGENATDLSPLETDRRGDSLLAIKAAQKECRRQLIALPDLTNTNNESAERFERRCAVEGELRQAFDSSKLSLIAGDGLTVVWSQWVVEPDFAVDFYLSTVTCPASIVSAGVAPAFVVAEDFDKWVSRFPFGMIGRPVPPLQTRVEDWLKAAIADDPHNRITAAEFRDRARAQFSDASKTQVETAWNKVAPPSRTGPGRKPKI